MWASTLQEEYFMRVKGHCLRASCCQVTKVQACLQMCFPVHLMNIKEACPGLRLVWSGSPVLLLLGLWKPENSKVPPLFDFDWSLREELLRAECVWQASSWSRSSGPRLGTDPDGTEPSVSTENNLSISQRVESKLRVCLWKDEDQPSHADITSINQKDLQKDFHPKWAWVSSVDDWSCFFTLKPGPGSPEKLRPWVLTLREVQNAAFITSLRSEMSGSTVRERGPLLSKL